MDFMKLKATLTLDDKEYRKGLDDGERQAKSFGGKYANALKVAKVGAVALGTATIAAAGAIAKLTRQSVEAYAEYEQLTGGIKKLYGEAYSDMMDFANQAYITAGMSANAYMQNVTGFSAALLNSVEGDSKKAAQIADMAMQDISDNANTFGKYTAEELAGVYQALAKGQYMTLDNLNLGFGGTKEGMQKLIDKANELARAQGEAGDLTIDSYADIVKAIHLVQENLNITGTTQKEAAKTIQGSINMAKAAWQNLLVGFANGEADISQLTQNFIQAASTVAENVAPAIMQAFQGIGDALTQIMPQMIEKIPEVISTYGAPLVSAGGQLVMSLINGIAKAAPSLVTTAFKLVGDLLVGIAKALPELIVAGLNLITGLLKGIADGEPELANKAGDIVKALVMGLIKAAPEIGKAALELVKALWNVFAKTNWLSLGSKALKSVLNGIKSVIPSIKSAVKGMVSHVINLMGFHGLAAKVGEAFENAKSAITQKLTAAKNKITSWISSIKGLFPINLGKILSFNIPTASVSVNKSANGGSVTARSTGMQRFAKAMYQPWLLNSPSMFIKGGEAGDELMYGRSALMRDIREATGEGNGNQIINYITIQDSNDPMETANVIIRQMKLELRTA